ncbi:MAG: cysteine peptidase family C39 domain-containing protein [Planctomycetota bacterium]|jgi:hypothetical protein
MGKKIENLRWKPMWVSHLGCLKGCLDHLGLEVTDAWLFGGTGHAFVINMHEAVCPSGPTAWNTEMIYKLGRNLGIHLDGLFALKTHEDFGHKQEEAWNLVQRAIDAGLPCYGWELEIPEFYVIYGYDDEGYYVSGPRCDEGKGPVPWGEVGDTEIGVLEMNVVQRGTGVENRTVVREALAFALEHATSPEKWIFPKYAAGLSGFDSWIRALEGGEAHDFGMAFNAALWHECREMSVRFLREAKGRLEGKVGPLFDEALEPYQKIAGHLKQVTLSFPFPPKGGEVQDKDLCAAAALEIREARSAEEGGLQALKALHDAL